MQLYNQAVAMGASQLHNECLEVMRVSLREWSRRAQDQWNGAGAADALRWLVQRDGLGPGIVWTHERATG